MYQHGKRVRRQRSAAILLATVVIVGVVILIAGYIVHLDIGSATDPKSNVPIVTDVDNIDSSEKVEINEPLFSMQLPSDWKLLRRTIDNDENSYIWISTIRDADDRKLTLHVDIMPPEYKIVKLQPLIVSSNKFLLGNISDNCVNFAGVSNSPQATGNASFAAKWENVSFICDPIVNNQTVGTGTADNGIAAKITGTQGEHAYFFIYEDHTVYPENNIVREALTSFTAK